MANLTWDASPSGVWKNHFLSSSLLEGAWEDSIFMDWVEPEEGFGKGKGESIDIFTITGPSEPANAQLEEGVRIPEDTVSISSVRLTVREFGRAITHTNLWAMLAKYDVSNFVQRRLRQQMRLTFDTKAASVAKAAKVCFIPTGVASGVFDNDGVPNTTATENMTLYHVQRIRDEMYGVFNVPFRDGSNYIVLASYKALRGLKDDPNWQQWKTFNTPEALARGEIGMIESCRFIETNHTDALSNAIGSGSVAGEAIFLGEEGIAYAEAETPELRVQANNKNDYGREMGVAWYGVCGWALKHDDANQGTGGRVVRFCSQ